MFDKQNDSEGQKTKDQTKTNYTLIINKESGLEIFYQITDNTETKKKKATKETKKNTLFW